MTIMKTLKHRQWLAGLIMFSALLLHAPASTAKGPLDGEVASYFKNTLAPLLMAKKLCTSVQDCREHEYFFCTAWTAISCEVYGITDERIVREIFLSVLNSELRVRAITFWASKYHKGSIFEKPLLEFIDHTGDK